MATEAQVLANRMNAQKSTGPRTVEGKEIVAQNAVKHGLRTERAVIVGEDLGEFEFYRDQMLGELAPAGAMESMLAERVVSLSWRLRRAERVQNEAFDTLITKDSTGPLARLTQSLRPRGHLEAGDDDLALGRAVVNDFAHARVLDRLLMYERRIEHSLYKTMSELQRLRLMRELDPPTENPTRQSECWGKPQPATPTPALENPTRQGECWGKPQPATPTPALENPTRQGECWGKPQPTTPTPALENPTRQGECWGKPQPTRATHQPTPGPVCAGGDEAVRQTKRAPR